MINETVSDRMNEMRFASLMTSRGWQLYKTKPRYACDFLAIKDNTKCLIEYKRRNFHSSTHPTSYLPASKFYNLRSFAREINMHPYYFAEYDDNILYCNLLMVAFSIRFAGRKDRVGDCYEPMIDIPIEAFSKLNLRPSGDQINMNTAWDVS